MKFTALFSLVALIAPAALAADAPGTTRIAQWQDDKKAAFLLMFDDGWPSHFQVALPELKKRNMIGTFYICPAKGEYVKFEQRWLKDMQEAGMVLGNHTMTHNGFQSPEDAAWEINACTEYLLKNCPGKNPRLISFGEPGVEDWKVSREEFNALVAKNHLIDRGTFRDHGANYHLKTTEQMLGLADKAIANGGYEYIVFHGLERIEPNWGYQDMWAVKQTVLLPFLDGLAERRDRGDLWITDHISAYKYQTERSTAKAAVLEATAKSIRLKVTDEADGNLYDEPLTLVTQVPPSWKNCRVEQSSQKTAISIKDGKVQFQALPNGEEIRLTPA